MRRKDGLFQRGTKYLFKYKNSAGNWQTYYTGETDREKALQIKKDFLANPQQKPPQSKMSMGNWKLSECIMWWNSFRAARISKTTDNSERYRLQHLQKLLGDVKLKQISSTDLDNYVTRRLEQGIGNDSINKEVRLWSMILRKAKLWRQLEDDYKPLRVATSDVGQALTREQLQHLAEVAATNPAWEGCFYGSVLAANTGMRGCEIKRLRIGVVDLERKQIRILRKVSKTDASARFIELNGDACEAVARLLLRARSLGATEPEHYLMPKNLSRISHGTHKGERGYDPNQHQEMWDSAWRSLTEAAGFPGLRFHDLRHSFCTAMIERGISVGVVQSIIGHMSAKMVLHYTHVASGVTRRAVELLDAEPLLAPTLTQPSKATEALLPKTLIQ